MTKYLSTPNLLLVSAFAGTLGGGLFWTGFPIAFAAKWSQYGSLSSVCAFAVAGSVLFDLIGGAISNLKHARAISILSLLASAVILASMIISHHFEKPILILILLPAMYFISSLANVSENVWLLSLSDKSSLQKSFFDRSSSVIFAKLIGFSLGPILFSAMALNALWICLILIGSTALLQSFIPPGAPSTEKLPAQSKKEAFVSVASNPLFILAFFSTGLLSVPMNLAFVERIVSLGSANYASVYWLAAGIVSFTAVRLLRREKLTINKLTLPALLIVAVVTSLSFSVDVGAIVTLACGAIYVFTSVTLSASLQIVGLKRFEREHLGVAIGTMNFLIDFGILIGLLLSDRVQSHAHANPVPTWLAVTLGIAICLRGSSHFGLMKAARTNV